MRAQSARYGYLVYIFSGDAETVKRQPGRKWNLYGLWTHSSCPVVQYICEESDRSGDRFGLELLGHCVPQGSRHRQAQARSSHSQWLVVEYDREKLTAELVPRSGLAPVPCSIKHLPGVSPFAPRETGQTRRYGDRSPERRRSVSPERRAPVHDGPQQWYMTSHGEEILRNIHNSCVSNFPAPSRIEMSRDAVEHNIQLSIKHNAKTFVVHFPSNFPQSPAQVLHDDAIYRGVKLPNEAKSKEEIIRMIRSYCGCYKCKNRR